MPDTEAAGWLLPVVLLLCVAISAGTSGEGRRGLGGVLWSVPEPWDTSAKLEDIRRDGALLISEPGDYSPSLSLRSVKDGRLIGALSLTAWHEFARSHLGELFYQGMGRAFRFLGHTDRILGVQYPWLVLIDARTGNEIRRALPSQDLLADLAELNARRTWYGKPTFFLAVALRTTDDYVATAYNYGVGPRIFVYDSELAQMHAWKRDRYVRDVSWSPDGKRIAVLYSGKYDQNRTYVGGDPKKMPVRLPDVEIIDAETGAKVVEFFTGGPEAKLAFSPDGSLLYTISEPKDLGYSPGDEEREVIRVFSPKSGDLLRTLTVKRSGVRSSFTISRDGRYIAADASTALMPWHFPLTEQLGSPGANERFVVLDAATGKVVFDCHRKTTLADGTGPLLSPDGRILVVGFGPDKRQRPGANPFPDEIVAYSLP
jgi:WD40 repeat protein